MVLDLRALEGPSQHSDITPTGIFLLSFQMMLPKFAEIKNHKGYL